MVLNATHPLMLTRVKVLVVTHAALLCPLLATTTAWAEPSVLEEVVVTGSRNLLAQALPLGDYSQTITSNEQVSLNRTAGDWLAQLPGVSLNGQGGLLQSYSVRGFSRWRIRTEVEGVPLFTDRRAGNAASFVPPDLLERVTVQRGPGSTLYGSDAMGGVINLSLSAPDAPVLTTRWQSNDQATDLMVASPISSRAGIAVATRRANMARNAQSQRLNSGYRQTAAVVRARTDHQGLALDAMWLPSVGRDIGKSARDFPDRDISSYPDENHSITRLQIADPGRWLARIYHHWQDWTARTERLHGDTESTRYRGHTVGGLFYATTSLAGSLGRTGIEWLGRRGVDITELPAAGDHDLRVPAQILAGEQDNVGLFSDQQWQFGPVAIGGGLRWDHIEQRGNDQLQTDDSGNASLAVDWSTSDVFALSARWGTGFRFPTLSERYFNGVTARGDTVGNPVLSPERNRGVEISGRMTHATLSGSVSWYRNQVRDYIERYRLTDTLRSFRNTERATIRGFEAQITWQPDERWRHSASYQWQRGEDESGATLVDLNPAEWRWFSRWQGEQIDISIDLAHRPGREAFGPGERPVGTATLANASIGWRTPNDWQFSCFATNVLNESWQASADEDAAQQPGRTVGLRIEWHPS